MDRTPSPPQLDGRALPGGWVPVRVAHRRQWRPGLVSLTLEERPRSCPSHDFTPGQWFRLGLSGGDGSWVSRPYCACSTPGAPLQFLVVMVPEGALSPRLVSLEPGSVLALWPRAAGDFTLGSLSGAHDLWLIATGTGLGPFLSMLHTDEVWRRFHRIVVVHAVREASDLVGRDELAALEPDVCWLPVVSRQPLLRRLPATDDDHPRPVLHGRVTDLLRTGDLEAAATRRLTPDGSQVMLCGNPGMVADMTAELAARGLRTAGPDGGGQVRGLAFWEPAGSDVAVPRVGSAAGDR